MDLSFARSGALRAAPPSAGRRFEFAALVAALAAVQATSATARAESMAARRRATREDAIAALGRIFAPRRGEVSAAAGSAGSFSPAVAHALAAMAATPGKPE